MTPEQFIAKWQHNTLSERAGAQLHFLDLCELLGVDKPGNPNENDNYCFERGAKRTGAGRGWADVWKRSHFAWEYKAPGTRLEAALKQLMSYALALDNPPLLVVSDRVNIEIHTHFTGTPSETHTIALEDIGQPANRQKLLWLFTEPNRFKPQRTRTAITKQAAELFGDLALVLQQRGHEPHKVAHFLNKILFCMFAESAVSIGSEPLLPNRLFSKVLRNGLKDPKRFEKQLVNLFTAMAEPNGEFGEHIIEWFNGGLFDDDVVIPLNQDDIQKIVNVATLDWSAIEPSIFGTLFERGLDPAKRGQTGAHYTDPGSIMRIVNPVIIEPLLAEWSDVKAKIAEHMEVFHGLENSRKSAEKARATTALKEANRLYIGFLERLKHFRVLDPACGSGNFLYLALQSLKDIEHRVILEAEELARVTVWIGEIQWMLKHGLPPSRNPILKKLDQIECRDALLTPSPLAPSATSPEDKGEGGGEGAFVEAEWPKVDVIIGNPPFLGDKKMIGELGEDYAGTLRAEYAGRVPGGADLVTYWFEKARAQIEAGQASRAGLVATNSIRGGASRKVLERILATVIPGRAQREPGIQNAANNLDSRVRGNDGAEGMPCRIYNAWSDEPWINDGAAVRVSIVCFGAPDTHLPIVLDGKSVSCIHANLSADQIGEISLDLTTARGLSENADGSYFGLCLAGAFAVEGETARQWLRAPGNPDGTQNRAVLRPLYNGLDVTRRPRDRWVIDFGVSMSEQQAAFYEEPFRHITEHVKPIRLANNRKSRVSYWWRHGETRPGLRRALTGIDRYIATSETSKHRYFVWLPVGVAPEHKLVVIPRADDVVFGMLSSRPHIVWALAMGSTLEDRPVYTTHACFQTFPFPDSLTPNLKPEHYTNPHTAEIAAAAQRLNELRENWLNPPEWVERVPEVVPGYPERVIPKPEYAKAIKERTLTNLYNKRAKHEVQWLEDAHRTLDAAVARAYGWDDYTPAMPDEEILRRLLALNLQRAGKA